VRLVDTHCHLDFDRYQEDLDQVLKRAWEAGVERIIIPAIQLESSQQVLDIAARDGRLQAAVGVHPNSCQTWEQTTGARLTEMVKNPHTAAVGEIGLDYYRSGELRKLQQQVLKHQLDLAAEVRKPVILHVRNRGDGDRSCIIDLMQVLDHWRSGINGEGSDAYRERLGVVHSFSGNPAEAEALCEMGFYIGITGPVTFKSGGMMREVVRHVPRSRLVLETDGPFLTPQPHRGQRNEPAYVRSVADKVAELWNCSAEEAACLTTENAGRLFNWR